MNITDPESIKPDLSALMEFHIAGTHGVLKDGCKTFCPKLIIQTLDPREGEKAEPKYICVIIAKGFNEPDEKHGIMERMGREMFDKMLLPLSVSLASECWLSNNQEGIMPSQSDDRREAISIGAMGIDRSSELQVMPFKRDKQQNIIEGPFVRYSGGVAESPLLESFYRGFFEVMEERDRKEGWKR